MNIKKTWKRFFSLDRRHAEGFTLVELIVVIAILAILGGVAVPAYSGYVEKAEYAADEALLAELNTAFAAACAISGESHVGRNDATATIDSDGFATVVASKINGFDTTFDGFYEGGEFKVFEALMYNAKNGAFEEATATMMNIYNILKNTYGEEIATLMASNLGAMGAEKLLTEAGGVVNWANTYGLADLSGDAFNSALLGYLGVNTDGKTDEQIQSEINAAYERLGGNPDQIVANAVALYAAQNTNSIDSDGISQWLNGESTVDSMKDKANANTLAEAAAIYGLYMSYKGDDFDSNNGALNVIESALTDKTGFAAWVKSDEGKAELEAYKASMAIVSGATADEDAKNAILSNGLDDPDLIKVLESLMGN